MNNLKYWRQERLLTQVELAQASGVPRYFIQLIEAGCGVPHRRYQEALCQTLSVDLAKIFPGGENNDCETER